MGYAFILTHPGTPFVFWDDFENGEIASLCKTLNHLRQDAGIQSGSSRYVYYGQGGLYSAIITGSNFKVAMKLGTSSWSPGSGWTLVTSGDNFAVWKSGSTRSRPIPKLW